MTKPKNIDKRRRSFVSGSVTMLFARPITLFPFGKSPSELRVQLREPMRDVGDGIIDAAAKMLAWLMVMATLVGVSAITAVIRVFSPAAAAAIYSVADWVLYFAMIMAFLQMPRIGLLWSEPDWSVDYRGGLRGRLQHAGDLDFIICAALLLTIWALRSM